MKKISDLLREEREKKGLTLEEVEGTIKIKKKHLSAIEEGKFYSLPSESYALGFVKNYAEFLGIPESKAAAFFRREYGEEQFEIIPEFRKTQHKFTKKALFSTKSLFILGGGLVVVGYIIFQYGSLLFGPKLSIASPKDGQIVNANIIEVKGKTDPYAAVLVNDDEAYVALNGTFKKQVFVFPGRKRIVVVAKNRFGKETRVVVNIVVK